MVFLCLPCSIWKVHQVNLLYTTLVFGSLLCYVGTVFLLFLQINFWISVQELAIYPAVNSLLSVFWMSISLKSKTFNHRKNQPVLGLGNHKQAQSRKNCSKAVKKLEWEIMFWTLSYLLHCFIFF